MTIQVTIKNVYGNDLVYPVDATAKKLCDLTGRKTFTQEHLEIIRALGFKIEVVSAYTL